MKILMTLMGLEIGGAETHVIELSKALAKMGHDITVVSNGGVYTSELEEENIRHVCLPLNTKTPSAVIKSYFSLKKLIKEEKFDIVHAHARIPAFICGLLQKRLKFRYITSAHWVFKVTPLWKFLSNWGERSVAVSEDIKQYLIDNYHMNADNISVTINGVDTDKFSEDADWSDIEKEFSLSRDTRKIVYVSRMDTSRSEVAYLLCKIADKLKKKYPDIEIVIVGDGNDLPRIKEEAARANKEIGEDFIHIAGGRTDINKFMACSDIFVGVSRSALEAMSASKPVIIAGNEGYIGIYDESKREISVATNFCCRGCAQSNTELLYKDLDTLLSSDKETLRTLGEYNRNVIMENYSVRKMANDYIEAYEKLTPYEYYKHGDIIISGYYGFNNTGDDSILSAIIGQLKEEDKNCKITVLGKNPKKMRQQFGVRCIGRRNPISITSEMKHAKLLISGGGNILQNSSSTFSLLYYTQIIKMAKKYGLKVMMYANGIGPLIGERSKKIAGDALKKADIITLREPSSKEELQKFDIDLSHITVSADPALSLSPATDERIKYIFEKTGVLPDKKYFVISVRDWDNLRNFSAQISRKDFKEIIADSINEIAGKTGYIPIFIPMQPKADTKICQNIRQKLKNPGILASGYTASELIGILKHTEFVIGMRLHLLIYATNANVPILGISYDPKVDAFLQYCGKFHAIDVNSVSKEKIVSAVDELLSGKEEAANNASIKSSELNTMIKEDAKTAIQLLAD